MAAPPMHRVRRSHDLAPMDRRVCIRAAASPGLRHPCSLHVQKCTLGTQAAYTTDAGNQRGALALCKRSQSLCQRRLIKSTGYENPFFSTINGQSLRPRGFHEVAWREVRGATTTQQNTAYRRGGSRQPPHRSFPRHPCTSLALNK